MAQGSPPLTPVQLAALAAIGGGETAAEKRERERLAALVSPTTGAFGVEDFGGTFIPPTPEQDIIDMRLRDARLKSELSIREAEIQARRTDTGGAAPTARTSVQTFNGSQGFGRYLIDSTTGQEIQFLGSSSDPTQLAAEGKTVVDVQPDGAGGFWQQWSDGSITRVSGPPQPRASSGGGGGGGQSDASRLAIAQLQAQSRELGDKANNAARLGLQQDAQRFSAQQADIDRRINEFQFGVTAGLDRDRFGLERQLGLGGLQLESAGLLNQLLQSPVDAESILEFMRQGGGNIGNAIAGGFSALNERNLQPAAQALDVLRGIPQRSDQLGGGGLPPIGTSGAVINGDDLVTSAVSAPVSSSASVRNFAQRIAPPPEPIAPITPAGPGNIGPLSPQQLAGAREGQRQGVLASKISQFLNAPPTREEFAAGVGRGQAIPPPALTIPGISAGESTGTAGPGAVLGVDELNAIDLGGARFAANKGGTIPLGALASVGEGPSGKAPNREMIFDLPDPQGVLVLNPEQTKQIEKQGLQIPQFQAGGIFQPVRSDQLGDGPLPPFQPAGQSSIEAVRGLREGAFVPQDFSLQQADFFNRSPTFQSAAPRGLAVRTGVTEADVLAEIKKFRLKGFGRGQLAIGA